MLLSRPGFINALLVSVELLNGLTVDWLTFSDPGDIVVLRRAL